MLRYPALLVTVVAGTAMLALAAAAAPLFLSATSSQIVAGSIARPHITRYMAGLTYRFEGLPLDPTSFGLRSPFNPTLPVETIRSPDVADLDAAFRELAAGSPLLADPTGQVLGDPISVSFEDRTTSHLGRLFGAPEVLDHVERLAGGVGDGVWIPELIAKDLGVGPGDTIELLDASRGHTRLVEATVDGIYRDIYLALPPDGYWLPWEQEFRLPSLENDRPPPPQPILAGRGRVLGLTRGLGQTSATFSWQAPVADPEALSLEDVQALDAYASYVRSLGFSQTPLGRTLQCCGRWGTAVPDAETLLRSSVDAVAEDAEHRFAAARGPAQVLEIAAIAVALVVVAASGAFAMRARRTEADWLFARGISPPLVGVKTALETLVPALAGGLLGCGLAVVAVRAIGPDGAIDRGAYVVATTRAAASVVVAVVVSSLVAAIAYLRMVDPHRRGLARIAAAVPWELGAIWMGFLAYRHLDAGGAFFTDETLGVDRPSLALVAFPFLILTGLAFLSARLALLAFGKIRSVTARSSPPMYLATRRLAAGGALAASLMGAAGLCLGMFVHSRLVSGSLEATVDAKSRVFVGSDVAMQVSYVSAAPEDFPFPITRVVQAGEAVMAPSGRSFDLLAIDPSTFATAAYWNDAFAATSLDALVQRLDDGAGNGDLPILLAAGDGLDVDEIVVGTSTVPVRVAGRADAFPGLFSLRPLVVVDERALVDRIDGPNPLVRGWAELWARGDPQAVLEALATRGVPVYLTISAEEVADIPAISAAIGTFVVVNALGTVAAALILVSMLAYVRARQRSQVVSYALSTRMGMTHPQHRRALTLELGLMVGIGFVAGTAFAIGAAAVTVPLLDPLASIPPAPLFVVPRWGILAAGAGVALVSWIGAAAVSRRARSADLAEVMRVAE